MFGCITFQIDPLKFIADTLKDLSRPIGYLRDPKQRITRLTDAMEQLRVQSEDRRIRIRQADLVGEVPTQEVQYWFNKVDDFIAQILKIIDDRTNGSFRWRINRRAEHILADIKAFRENFVLDVLTTKLPPKGVQEVPAELPAAPMDIYLSQLETAIEDENSRIIGIWGMGGVGKTTLLSNLNNKLYSLRQLNFDYIIWVVASKDYKLGKLQSDIAERLGLPLCQDTVMQAKKIMEFLKNKSFLLLLDDLWKPVEFAELGIPDPSRTRETKQKVVFTTRLEDVCGKMQARPRIKIECLDKAGAWRLFQDKVGEETLQAHAMIPQLAWQVAKECDGLPLAIVLIGSAMSTKKTPREWQNAITLLQKSRPYEILGMDDKIFSKLKFSYDNLPDEIFRKCFLLCSLWPEDYSFRKTDLIECWMGHGLVDERKFDNINEAYDSGYSLIGGLQAACLLEPGDNEETMVKMHDVVRDLAMWIASDCGKKPNIFIVHSSVIASKDSQRKAERISLVNSDISDTSFLPVNCSELKTLMLQKSKIFKSIVPGFFEGTPALTYLDLSQTRICNLPKEIGLLQNLRYLNLSRTHIKFLPSELGCLRELRFLFLRHLHSIIISSGVLQNLEMLSVIDITYTKCIKPQELSTLRGHLKGLAINLESIEDLHQLAHLPNVLTWKLTLAFLFGLNQPLQLLSPSQLGSRNICSSIQELTIENCYSLEVMLMESDGGGGIQKLCLLRLEFLWLTFLPKLQDIIWRGVCPAQLLPSLTTLFITFCHNLSNISWVIRLPSLEILCVKNCDNVKQIFEDDYSEFAYSDDKENGVGMTGPAFPSLRVIELDNLKSLRVFGGSYTFPSLESLKVLQCPEMKRLPFGAETTRMKLKVIRGLTTWWEELDMEDYDRATLLPYFQAHYST